MEGNKSDISAIKVVIRIRPVNETDHKQARVARTSGPEVCVNLKPDGQTIHLVRDAFHSRQFRFDHVFGTAASQAVVYKYACDEIIKDFTKGFNACILCYGQTGTGKTYTMFGTIDGWNNPTERSLGILHYSLRNIFAYINQCREDGRHGKIYVSFYEIYLESVTDLLLEPTKHTPKRSLLVREDPVKGVYLEGLSSFPVEDEAAVYDLINSSVANRVTHELTMNMASSRSHAVLQVTMEHEPENVSDDASSCMDEDSSQVDGTSGTHLPNVSQRRKIARNVFTFGDLAGSERVRKTGSVGARLKEAKAINKSISALGNCVQALAANGVVSGGTSGKAKKRASRGSTHPHIPFRDSKLTRLLADALSGNSRTCFISTVGPCLHSYEETLSTLVFASRAACVKKVVVPVKRERDIFADMSTAMQDWTWPVHKNDPSVPSPNPESKPDILKERPSPEAVQYDSALSQGDLQAEEPGGDRGRELYRRNLLRTPNSHGKQRSRSAPPSSRLMHSTTERVDYSYNVTAEEMEGVSDMPIRSRCSTPDTISSSSSRKRLQLHPSIVQKRLSETWAPHSQLRSNGGLEQEFSRSLVPQHHAEPKPGFHAPTHNTYGGEKGNGDEYCTENLMRHEKEVENKKDTENSSALDFIEPYECDVGGHDDDDFLRNIYTLDDERKKTVYSVQDLLSLSEIDVRPATQTVQHEDNVKQSRQKYTGGRDDVMELVGNLEKEMQGYDFSADVDTPKHELIDSSLEDNKKQIIAPQSDLSRSSPRSPVLTVTVSRDIVPLSRVPPPPPIQSKMPPAPVVSKIDTCTLTDISVVEYIDKSTNTPRSIIPGNNPCPTCYQSQSEVIHLKNELCRYLEDINRLKSIVNSTELDKHVSYT